MPDAPAVDPMLQLFVRLMNSLDVQLGVTVLVGGSWVSGTLIPPRTFTEEVGADLVDKAGAEAEGLQQFFGELGRQWFPRESEVGAAPDAAPREGPRGEDRPFHLHLRHARMVTTGGSIPMDGAYMRIRLAEVTGWVVGDFSSTHPFRPPTPPQHTDS
ncbi:MAG: hypothetical protein QOI56_351 [Actinomycetota bacterium]|jgi:hypothetical protein|nr:hypothetical protein [Actinomycetota bacterium]MEA2931566.1 hypothetical protein [Actinomycetota bacterium]